MGHEVPRGPPERPDHLHRHRLDAPASSSSPPARSAFAGSDVTMTSQEQTAGQQRVRQHRADHPDHLGRRRDHVQPAGHRPRRSTCRRRPWPASSWARSRPGTTRQIAADNPGVTLPSTADLGLPPRGRLGHDRRALRLPHRDRTVGMDARRQQAVQQLAGRHRRAPGSSGVAQGVKSTTGGITYAEITYAQQDDLTTAAIKGATGGFVNISPSDRGEVDQQRLHGHRHRQRPRRLAVVHRDDRATRSRRCPTSWSARSTRTRARARWSRTT